MASLVSWAIMAIIPPDLVFKFHKLFFTLFQGRQQDALVQIGLAWIEEFRDFSEESSEHMSDHSQIPEPSALRSLFQAPGLYGFLPRMKRFEKEKGVTDDVLSLLPIGLLVGVEQEGQFPSGQRRLGKIV